MNLLETTYPAARPAPATPAVPQPLAILFGFAPPYPVVGARPGNRMDPPRDQSAIMKSARDRMLERRASLLETLKTDGEATTIDLAVWVDSNPDAVLKDLRFLQTCGDVACHKEVRHGHEALVWNAVKKEPDDE